MFSLERSVVHTLVELNCYHLSIFLIYLSIYLSINVYQSVHSMNALDLILTPLKDYSQQSILNKPSFHKNP